MSLILTKSLKVDKSIPVALVEKKDKAEYILFDPEKGEKSFSSDDDLKVIPYHDKKHKQRSAIYISGIAGSGKSSLCAQILETTDPDRIILFSTASELDPVYRKYEDEDEKHYKKCVKEKKEYKPKFIRINLKTDEALELVQVENLKDSTCVFDDFQVLTKNRFAVVQKLLDDCLENGRKLNIQIISIVHQSQNYNKTRNIIFESDTFILFPWTNQNAVKKFLKSYGDMNDDEIKEAIDMSSNKFDFLLYRKSYPRYIQTKRQIKLL